VRTAAKCLMRQTDNLDNSAGDRIENSATEITRSAARGMKAEPRFYMRSRECKIHSARRIRTSRRCFVEILRNVDRGQRWRGESRGLIFVRLCPSQSDRSVELIETRNAVSNVRCNTCRIKSCVKVCAELYRMQIT